MQMNFFFHLIIINIIRRISKIKLKIFSMWKCKMYFSFAQNKEWMLLKSNLISAGDFLTSSENLFVPWSNWKFLSSPACKSEMGNSILVCLYLLLLLYMRSAWNSNYCVLLKCRRRLEIDLPSGGQWTHHWNPQEIEFNTRVSEKLNERKLQEGKSLCILLSRMHLNGIDFDMKLWNFFRIPKRQNLKSISVGSVEIDVKPNRWNPILQTIRFC